MADEVPSTQQADQETPQTPQRPVQAPQPVYNGPLGFAYQPNPQLPVYSHLQSPVHFQYPSPIYGSPSPFFQHGSPGLMHRTPTHDSVKEASEIRTPRIEQVGVEGEEQPRLAPLGDRKAKDRKLKAKDRPKGQGARSGKNAREGGRSDDEIEELDSKVKANAGLKLSDRANWTDEQKTVVITYCTDSERWQDFKIKQAEYFQHISQHKLLDKTTEQVRSCWNRLWAIFGAVRARQQHTGGGDGDDFQVDRVDPAETESVGDAARKKKKNGVTYTDAQLDTFEQSEHFRLLDEVAHNHPSIKKLFKISSDRPAGDEGDEGDEATGSKKRKKREEDDLDDLLRSSLRDMATRRDHTDKRDEDRLAMERERHAREVAAAKREEEATSQALLAQKWAAYHAALEHSDPFTRKRADKLKKEIAVLEGFDLDE